MNKTDQIIGCIIGGAIGDAFGGAYENQLPPIDFSADHKWRLSDDTQLTLATCEAMIASGDVIEPAKIAARFAVWHSQKRITGLGASTLKAVTELMHGGHWALVGRKGDRAAGNGAAMRIAPLAFCLDPKEAAARQIIRDVSRITHHHEEAYAGALAVVVAVRSALTGDWQGEQNLLELVIAALPDTSVRDRLIEFSKLDLPISYLAQKFGCSGYVVESVPLAIYAAQQILRLGFAQMMQEIISVGGDTDTNASIAGQIAGTLIGCQQLPVTMIEKLPERDMSQTIAHDLATLIAF